LRAEYGFRDEGKTFGLSRNRTLPACVISSSTWGGVSDFAAGSNNRTVIGHIVAKGEKFGKLSRRVCEGKKQAHQKPDSLQELPLVGYELDSASRLFYRYPCFSFKPQSPGLFPERRTGSI
jgi:hypothetical protein